MVDFGRDQICYVPGAQTVGSSNERSWDQYDEDSPGKYSRPRGVGDAQIAVHTAPSGYLLRLQWPKYPALTVEIVVHGACVAYEV